MQTPDKVIEIGAWMLEHSHRALLAVSGGRFPKKVLGMQPVELHTTGRRSGQPRSTMLTSPICEPDRIVLVASKGGHRDHPDWYKNLVAHPDVELTVDSTVRCEPCEGSGAKSGTSASACSMCGGRGQVRARNGFFVVEQTCPTCRGVGEVIDGHAGSPPECASTISRPSASTPCCARSKSKAAALWK